MNGDLINGNKLLGKRKNRLTYIFSYVVIFISIAILLFFYFFSCAYVNGHSMENTLFDSHRCFMLQHGYTINRGDIITINHPEHEKNMLIKRVVGLGGDKILFVRSENNVYVDMYICESGKSRFKLKTEKYTKEERMVYGGTNSKFGLDINGNIVPTADYRPREQIESINVKSKELDENDKKLLDKAITVKKNHVYYMGDNRNHSTDSRYYGTCSEDDVTGKVLIICKIGGLLEDLMGFLFPRRG